MMDTPDRQDDVVERRQNRRFEIPLNGRLMLSDRCEFDCLVIDVSPRNVFLKTDADGRRGERVIAYVDHIGRIEGRVVRVAPFGFAMELDMSAVRREKLSIQLRKLADLLHKRKAAA